MISLDCYPVFLLLFSVMKRCALFLSIITPALAVAVNASAVDVAGLQPPPPYGVFSTMTAGSPAQGKFVTAFSFEKELGEKFHRLAWNSAFGVTDSIELSLTVADHEDGLEDIGIGLKQRLVDETESLPALAYLVTASVPSGDERLSTGGRVGGGVILSKRVGPFNGHLNLIFSVPAESSLDNEFRFSSGVVFSAAHSLWLLGELYGRSTHFASRVDELEARFGYRVLINDEIYTTFGMGIDLEQSDTKYRLMASVSLSLPREKKVIERIYEE